MICEPCLAFLADRRHLADGAGATGEPARQKPAGWPMFLQRPDRTIPVMTTTKLLRQAGILEQTVVQQKALAAGRSRAGVPGRCGRVMVSSG